MSYTISYSRQARKEIEKLPHNVAENILKGIDSIKIRPYSYIEKVIRTDYFRLKIRKYRILLKIINNDLVIMVIRIGHRGNIYN